MSFDSYKLTRNFGSSNPRKQMLYEKQLQVEFLYDLAADREDDTFLNGNSFVKSPRIFDHKLVDNVHHKITVETIEPDDWMECGDYLEYDGMHWLCLNSYSFHGLYCRATFMSCDWKLYWQDENEVIQSIYVVDQNSTQYNSGESGNATIILGAAQHMLLMQCDERTILFDTPRRFAIDKNVVQPTVYRVTQNDNSAYNYGTKGLCCVTVTEDQLNRETDKYVSLAPETYGAVVDSSYTNIDYIGGYVSAWICDYSEPETPFEPSTTTDVTAIIQGNKELYVGFKRNYTVAFYDSNGSEIVYEDYSWNFIGDSSIDYVIDGTKLTVSTDNEDLLGETFTLQIIVSDVVLAELSILITEMM